MTTAPSQFVELKAETKRDQLVPKNEQSKENGA